MHDGESMNSKVISFENKLLKNANERDIMHSNERMFMITNSHNLKNNLNISINNITPIFDNSKILNFNSNKSNTNLKSIYTDLSKYLNNPKLDNNINFLVKNECLNNNVNNSFLNNFISPRKIKLDPIINNLVNDQFKIKSLDTPNNKDKNEEKNENSNIIYKLNKISADMKFHRKNISSNLEQKQSLVFMPKNLKLKKYPEHPFNKILNNISSKVCDQNDILSSSRNENDYPNKSINMENELAGSDVKINRVIFSKINKKIEKNSQSYNYDFNDYRKNKLKPIAITNQSAIKNISSLVYDLMEKNNVIEGINSLFDNVNDNPKIN